MKSFGTLIADKQEGPFRLELDWIKAYTKKQLKPEMKKIIARLIAHVIHESGIPVCLG